MLLVIAALLAAGPARAQDAPQPPPGQSSSSIRSLTAVRVEPVGADGEESRSFSDLELTPTSSKWYSLYAGNRFGLLVDGGAPLGAGVAGVFRPWSLLRVEGGLNWNYLSFGLRGGVTVIPFEWGITPTIHLEGGHFFTADASRFTSDAGAKVILSSVPEDFLSSSLGFEFGSQQRFVFFLRVGLCWIRTRVQNIAQAINAENGGTPAKYAANAPVLLQVPTVSAGVLLFLF